MSKQEADNLKNISMFWLRKQGLLKPGCFVSTSIQWTHGFTETKSSISISISLEELEKYARLTYSQSNDNGDKKDFDYRVPIVSTSCRFGGFRYWFICPLSANGKYCGRRVAVLYKAGDYFGCRHCYDLTYESRNENRRSKHYPLFAVLDYYKDSEDLEGAMKRRFYKGRPTKKQQRLDRMAERAFPYALKTRELK